MVAAFVTLSNLIGVLGCNGALDLVVVGGAQVARVVIGVAGLGQVGGGVGGRNGDEAGLREQGLGRAGFAGARGADDGHDRVVRGQLGASSLARTGIAAAVLTIELDVVVQDLAAGIVNGDLNAVAGVDAQGLIRAGDDQQVGNMDRIAGAHIHAADAVGALEHCGAAGCAVAAAGASVAAGAGAHAAMIMLKPDEHRDQHKHSLRHSYSSVDFENSIRRGWVVPVPVGTHAADRAMTLSCSPPCPSVVVGNQSGVDMQKAASLTHILHGLSRGAHHDAKAKI